MKNNFIILIFTFLISTYSKAENLNIKATSISIDKNTKVTILKENVI